MNLQDLVDFVQEHFQTPERMPESNALAGAVYLSDPNEPFDSELPNDIIAQRPPIPSWIREGGEYPAVTESDDLRVEGEIGQTQLPQIAEVKTWGVDALAFYLPFHFYRQRWGIYLRMSGMVYLAQVLNHGRPVGASDDDLLNLSKKILLEHEGFHFTAEVACSRVEVANRTPAYTKYFPDMRASRAGGGVSERTGIPERLEKSF
jgi:hypothetical protein